MFKIVPGSERPLVGCSAFEVRDVNILDSRGTLVRSLKNVSDSDSRGVQIVGTKVFWKRMVALPRSSDNFCASSEIIFGEVRSKDEKKVAQNEEFLVSPNGDLVALTCGDDACLYDVRDGKVRKIAFNGAGIVDSPDGFQLLQWSSNGSSLWLGSGVSGGWGAIGKYESGRMEWFPVYEESFALLNPDKGWLVWSTQPGAISGDEEVEKSKKNGIDLILCDVKTGRSISVAHALFGHDFQHEWRRDNLIFRISNGNLATLPKGEIESKMAGSRKTCHH